MKEVNDSEVLFSKWYLGVDQKKLQGRFKLSEQGDRLLFKKPKEGGPPAPWSTLTKQGAVLVAIGDREGLLAKVLYLYRNGEVSYYLNCVDGNQENMNPENWLPCSLDDYQDREAVLKRRAKKMVSL